jgi:cell division protein FtsX
MNAAWIGRNVRRQVGAHPRMVVATGAAFCLVALVAGGARLGTRVVTRWGAFASQNVHVIAFLAENVDEERARGLAEILARSPRVTKVAVIEPEEALARLGAMALTLASDARPLEGLEPSYFPRSLEVSLAPSGDLAQRAAELGTRLRSVPGVVEVDAMSGGVARLALWIKLGRTVGVAVLVALGLLALLALVTVFLRNRGAVVRRAAVLAQLGETPAGIRLPSSLWTAAVALLGGGTGALLLTLGWNPILARLESHLGVASDLGRLPLAGLELASGLVLLAIVGLAMGYFATPLPSTSDHG